MININQLIIAGKETVLINAHRHPATVEFGGLECCALRRANLEPEHRQFIDSYLNDVRKTNPPYRVAVLSEIFENTTRLVFIPQLVHRSFYSKLAGMEIELIRRREDINLGCHHSAGEHVKALQSVGLKMLYPNGEN